MEEKKLPHDHGHNNEEKIREHLPGENEIAGVSEAMKQLGDPSRLRIFWLLCHCEECVLNIAAIVNMSSPAVSQRPDRQPPGWQGDVLPDSRHGAGADASSYDRKDRQDHLSRRIAEAKEIFIWKKIIARRSGGD